MLPCKNKDLSPDMQISPPPPTPVEILEVVVLFMCDRSTGLWEVGAKDRISLKN